MGLVLDMQVGCLQSLPLPIQGFDSRGCQSRRQQGPFDGVGCLAGVEQLLGGMGQRIEEIADFSRREKHLYREWPGVSGQSSRESEVVDDALDQQHVHFQSVAMLIPVQHLSLIHI